MPVFPTVVSDDEEIIRQLMEGKMVRRKAEEELFSRHIYFIKKE